MEELNKQAIIDEEHLRLLVIFHRIYGILVLVLSLLGIAYFFLLNFLFNFSRGYSRFTIQNNFQGPPAEVLNIILIVMMVAIMIGLAIGICNLLSAQYIKNRKFRIFSIVVACIDCLSLPLGTILGVMTLIVLSRHSVIEYYKTLQPNV